MVMLPVPPHCWQILVFLQRPHGLASVSIRSQQIPHAPLARQLGHGLVRMATPSCSMLSPADAGASGGPGYW